MGNPRRHHYVAQNYLRRWSLDEKRVLVAPLPPGSAKPFLVGIRDLAVEKDLYAIETQEGRDQSIETDLTAPIDAGLSRATDALLEGRPASFLDLALAIGLQMMRGPETRDHISYVKTEIERARTKFSRLSQDQAFDESELDGIVAIAEQNEWIGLLLSSATEMAAVLADMSWSFVYFGRPVLVTSETPISMWRREELDREDMGFGPQSVDELRLPLAPTLALVLTHDAGNPQRVKGDDDMAREMNIGTCEFAMRDRIIVVPHPPPAMPANERELGRRPIVSALSVLPPLQAHRIDMGRSLIDEMRNIPGLEDIADEIAGPPDPENETQDDRS